MEPQEDPTPDTPTEPTKQLPARTLIQGAVVTAVIALVSVVQKAASDGVEHIQWTVTGAAALTAVLMAVASYLMAHLVPPK